MRLKSDLSTELKYHALVIETAAREGPEHGNTAAEETLLYLIHGLLHLNGHEDHDPDEREAMHRIQEDLLRQILN
ncbi:MAG: rRNA maturation RNAse YbeY [Planctomycetota bacterium]